MKTLFNALISIGLALSLAACGGGTEGCKLSLGGLTCKTEDPPNKPPLALAGAGQSVTVDSLVTLDGSASQDANLDALTYAWQMTSRPDGSLAQLSSTTAPKPTFTADKAGEYAFTLTVSDGQASSTSTTTVTATAANLAPVANAGPSQNALVGRVVTLDGSKSSDEDKDLLSYAWTLTPPAGSGARLDNASFSRPQFTPDVAGTYIASLFVSDGKSTSAMAVTRIEASSENLAPVAKTGTSQRVNLGARVVVDGSDSSDANGDRLTYSWRFIYTPPGSQLRQVDTPSAAITTFTPDVLGDYVLGLSVSDPQGSSSTVNTTVNVGQGNLPPQARVVQSSISARPNEPVLLDGSPSTDPNGDRISYEWSVVSVPTGSAIQTLGNRASVITSFTPDLTGNYVLGLRVSDGLLTSDAQNVVVTVSSQNLAPVARTGADQAVTFGTRVVVDGSTSADGNQDPLTYSWKFVYTPPASRLTQVDAPSAAITTFTPDVVGDYVLGLSVSDPQGSSSTVNTKVSVALGNLAPQAEVKASSISARPGELVLLDGSPSTDPNGDRISYDWSVVSAPTGSAIQALLNRSSAITTFTPDLTGNYVFGLRVSDASLTSDARMVVVSVSNQNLAPVAVVGPDQFTTINQPVVLDGASSYDANGDLMTYDWSVVSAPAGSAVRTPSANRLAGVNMPRPLFTPDVEGIYVFGLKVSDGKLVSPIDYLRVTVSGTNAAPTAVARAPLNVRTGSLVMLDGSASSDANNDPLTYTWSVISWPGQSAPTLSLVNPRQPSFVASAVGTYVFGLTVNDGKVSSEMQTVSVTASSTNLAPVAFAGPDRTVATGSSVILDGTGSTDANGDRLTYTWVMRSRPADSLSSLFTEPGAGGKASFVADKSGSYVVSLVVNDGLLDSNMSVITLTAGTPDPTAPIADAGENITTTVGSSVVLNGLGSRDPAGAVLTYIWSLEPNASGFIPSAIARLLSTTAPRPAFVADAPGVYVLSLRVSNGTRLSEKSFVTVVVN